MMKFLAVVIAGMELHIYIVPATNREHAYHVLSQLPRIRAYYAQSTSQQRPLFIHMIPMPESDQVSQIYMSQF